MTISKIAVIILISVVLLFLISACSNIVGSLYIKEKGLIEKEPIFFIIPEKNCTDADGDTYNLTRGGRGNRCGPADCNDNDTTVYSGALEICDLKDNDCDEVVDEDCVFVCTDNDNDGYGVGDLSGCTNKVKADCDDTNSSINPGAVEICNSLDDNCNSLTL